MLFKTDENIHPDLAVVLRLAGHDALTVWDQNLRGKPDADLARVCMEEKRVLVTLDTDFGDIRAYPPEQFAGMIVLRLLRQDRNHLLDAFGRVMPMLDSEPLTGHLWIVDENNLRIYGKSR